MGSPCQWAVMHHDGPGSSESLPVRLSGNHASDDPDRSDVELRLKRKWKDGTESLVLSQRDFVERLAGVIPPTWFNLTRFHGVFAPNHAWRDFVVQGPRKNQAWPAHDDPNASDPPPTGKPSPGRAPAGYVLTGSPRGELLRRTLGLPPQLMLPKKTQS